MSCKKFQAGHVAPYDLHHSCGFFRLSNDFVAGGSRNLFEFETQHIVAFNLDAKNFGGLHERKDAY